MIVKEELVKKEEGAEEKMQAQWSEQQIYQLSN